MKLAVTVLSPTVCQVKLLRLYSYKQRQKNHHLSQTPLFNMTRSSLSLWQKHKNKLTECRVHKDGARKKQQGFRLTTK